MGTCLEVTCVFPSSHGNCVYRGKIREFYYAHVGKNSMGKRNMVSQLILIWISIAYKNLLAHNE